MRLDDLILARRALRTAITHLMDARVGASGVDRAELTERIEVLMRSLEAVKRDLYRAAHPEVSA